MGSRKSWSPFEKNQLNCRVDPRKIEKAGRQKTAWKYRLLRTIIFIQNHEMIDKAEDLRDEYYLIKMIPRPKITKKVEV
jgi:hypothetical protein